MHRWHGRPRATIVREQPDPGTVETDDDGQFEYTRAYTPGPEHVEYWHVKSLVFCTDVGIVVADAVGAPKFWYIATDLRRDYRPWFETRRLAADVMLDRHLASERAVWETNRRGEVHDRYVEERRRLFDDGVVDGAAATAYRVACDALGV